MKFTFDADDLRPLIEHVVEVTLERVAKVKSVLPDGRLGYTEPEAAQRLGVAPHVLRDARLRGEIKARRVGKRWVYSHETLVRFLQK